MDKKNISSLEFENIKLTYACKCKQFEIRMSFVNYNRSKFFSCICRECSFYFFIYLNVHRDQFFYTHNVINYTENIIEIVKVTSYKLTVLCICGEKYVIETFKEGSNIEPRKCVKCHEFFSLYGCRFKQTITIENIFNRNDHTKLFEKYGYCTFDPKIYGYTLVYDEVKIFSHNGYEENLLYDQKEGIYYYYKKMIKAKKLDYDKQQRNI
jgi:hypothetical protein